MFIALSEIYIFIYIVMEQYIFERLLEIRMQDEIDFFLMVDELSLEDCTMERDADISLAPSLGVSNPNEPTEVETVKVKREVSELDNEALDFLDTLQSELGVNSSETESQELQEEMFTYSDEDIPPVVHGQDFIEPVYDEADLLHIDDINEGMAIPNDEEYRTISTTKIKDNLDGEQQWIAFVVGIEGTFIHVTDGSRLWINVGNSYINKISKGNLLALDINKQGNKVDVKHVVKLENGCSEDYSIPDEKRYEYSELREAI